MAAELAKRSLCTRDQVGAVIVDRHNKVIGEGYNGPPRGFWHAGKPCTEWCQRTMNAKFDGELTVLNGELTVLNAQGEVIKHLGLHPTYDDCPSLHAEANALLMADRSLCAGGIIYVTSHLCFGCAKLIANSGLSHVVVQATATAGHRTGDESYAFLRQCKIEVMVIPPSLQGDPA